MKEKSKQIFEIKRRIVEELSTNESINHLDFCRKNGFDPEFVRSLADCMEFQKVELKKNEEKRYEITSEGKKVLESGSPAKILFSSVTKEGITVMDLNKIIVDIPKIVFVF